MFGRYAFGIPAGALITMVILFGMQALIATARSALDETESRYFVDFVRVEREENFEMKERKLERPARPEAPPPAAETPNMDSMEPVGAAFSVAPVAVETEVSIGGLGLDASDGDYLPIVKIAPVYPWKAQTQGIEGRCLVEYTVTPAGTTTDIVVVEAEPRKVFDKASIDAAAKFKYRPRVVNGEPIEVRGVRNLFVYTLEG